MSLGRKHRRRLALLALAAAAAIWASWSTLATAGFLLDLAGQSGFPRSVLPGRSEAVATEFLSIPTRHGTVLARLDVPVTAAARTIVVLPGVHGAGLDEPRLARFARRVAGTGVNVLSVPLPDLRAFRITARSTDVAEDAARWASESRRLAPDGRVGLAGVSFAGGLAIVAAGRPALSGRLTAVLSVGGHGDLGRVLDYLCTGRLPDGTVRPPHDYSLAVVALTAVHALVPGSQVPDLERGILAFLNASIVERPDEQQAADLTGDARRLAALMPEPSRSIMTWVLERDVEPLGRALEPFIDDLSAEPALSPERSPVPNVPVFLLQGLDDNVIPASETPRLAAHLDGQGTPDVRWLLTPVISHVGVDPTVRPLEWWRLLRFWRAVEDALR